MLISPYSGREAYATHGGVVHSYTRSVIIELEVGDAGRRCSYRGLFSLRGAKLRLGGN